MQMSLITLSFLALASAGRAPPQQGQIANQVDQAAPVVLQSAYDRMIKAAAQVEKITGDASLLRGKRSKAVEKALVEDPKVITSDALQLATQAYALMGTKPAAQAPSDELRTAYHEILAAAEGIELVRRHADKLAAEKVTAFTAQVQKGPEKVEGDVKTLVEDMKAAEDDHDAAKKDLEEVKVKEEKTDDTKAHTEAEAANKAAKQGLAEASHEQHGGNELVGKARGQKKVAEKAAAKKAEAKVEVDAATDEHKAADATHAEADKVDGKHEEKVEKAEEKVEDAEEKHEGAKEAHDEHPDAVVEPDKEDKREVKKSGATQLASYAAVLTLAMFC